MKIHITFVYWTLLFISVVSSALLFVIVASENSESNYYSSVRKNESSEIYDNDTLESIENDTLESANIPVVKLKSVRKLDPNYEDYYQEQFPETSHNFETIANSETKRKENPYKDVDIVAESLPQQPNLSHGISGTEQAAVLTLVDTAAAELQSLVDPKFTTEFSRARIFGKNSSLLTKTTKLGKEAKKEEIEISSTPMSSTIVEESERSNKSIGEELLSNDERTSEGVVVVRAEQGAIIIDETEILENEDKILPDEVAKVDKIVTAAPELSDSDAKGRLMGHTRDEAPAIVIGEEIVPVGSPDPHEDIPSFNEWTQKRLEEAEKKKTHSNASVQNSGTPARSTSGMKVRSKNYASPDCGAKIVATNPEARSARSVLASTRDEYMLNTCTSRIWFVVELCEAIQAKKIELANFELFSSSPKDFSVYISDRFPTRDWSIVGQFAAKDVKDTQSFVLQPHFFGKFIKVELHTYHGSEHFCPVSLFRAYGTSEFEVLETETENQISRETSTDVDDEEDSDEEEPLDVEIGEPPRNLFGSARDAVLSIVKKAAQVLGKSREFTDKNITAIEQGINDDSILGDSFGSCTSPKYSILCDSCSAQTFAKVFQLVSCRDHQLNQLLNINFINRTLKQNGFCRNHAVDIEAFRRSLGLDVEKVTNVEFRHSRKNDFLTSIFKLEYIAALCNMIAIKEGKMVVNTSFIANVAVPFNSSKNISKENVSRVHSESVKSFESSSTVSTSNASTSKSASSRDQQKTSQELPKEEPEKQVEISSSSENVASQIKPTLEKEEVKNESSVPVLESSRDSVEETVPAETLSTDSSTNAGQHAPTKVSEELVVSPGTVIENTPQATAPVPVVTNDNNEAPSQDDVAADVEPVEARSTPNTVEKMERQANEQEAKQPEILEQEIKLSSQDSLTLDTLLSDLKDLEGVAVQMQGGSAASASATQSTMNIMPQKESVFLRLSNRIKALERNMSLSGQYLEELSRRYKKQVEEMQRSLERTVSVMSEETKKRDEREMKRVEEIAMLREEIAALSDSVKNLLYDHNSWQGTFAMIGQYVVLLCSQIFVIFLILMYCRSTKQIVNKEKQQLKRETLRRKSAENFSSHVKKTKKRRPSEIACHITGTYRELMIDERSQSKKERKRKRKKEAAGSGIKTILKSETRPNSVVDYPPNSLVYDPLLFDGSQNDSQTCKRPKHVSESSTDWLNNCEVKSTVQLTSPCKHDCESESVKSLEFTSPYIEDLSESNSLMVNMFPESEKPVKQTMDALNSNNSGVTVKDSKLSGRSFFMKTALSTRKKRKTNSNTVNGDWSRNSSDSNEKSVGTSPTPSISLPENVYSDCDTTANGLSVDQSDESRSSSVASMSKRKDRKSTTGFRKMVRKFF